MLTTGHRYVSICFVVSCQLSAILSQAMQSIKKDNVRVVFANTKPHKTHASFELITRAMKSNNVYLSSSSQQFHKSEFEFGIINIGYGTSKNTR